ncbi:hypothetical protein H7X46_25430 [Pseudonocardia sp. C8]|uniref:hypothetical protein n=1 Tax=Pseudonocardia sp. C8 TaxID=2762759 RepID=UPI0016426D1E|nr:hypothetical protein [Pseudonocardia sp. C8]MBC3194396.1 hypothetical protein [Pseudonocardia sp. C8]
MEVLRRPGVATRADTWRAGATAAVLTGAVLGAGVAFVMHRVPVDDAYIVLNYARQLGLHGNWGMVDGLQSNTATSPLSVLLLGGLTAVLRDAPLALAVATTAQFALAGYWLHGIARAFRLGRYSFPLLALAMLAVNPMLMSAYGLESQLALTLLVGAGWAVVTGRPTAAGLIAGLLVLTRPDLGPSALVVVAALRAGRWRAAGAALTVTVPWFAVSWWWLGSAVPDTVVIKGPESWGGTSFWNSVPHYWSILPGPVALSVVPAAAGLVAWAWWWRERLAWVWAGAAVVHYVTMSLLHPGPFFWHSTFWLCGLGLLGATAVARCVARRGPAGVTAGTLAAAYLLGTAWTGINDGLPRGEFAPISFNWATPAQYAALAARLPAGATVLSPGEIGTLAWFCECRVVDQFADRGRFTPLLEERLATAGPVTRALLEANYARFTRPQAVPLDLRIDTRLAPPGTPGGEWTSLFTRKVRVVTVSPAR